MVGDSLGSDIAGARALGIRSVWLNRRPDSVLDSPEGVPVIERDFTNHDHTMDCLLR